MCVRVYVCVDGLFVCVCVREREREGWQRGREGRRKRMCLSCTFLSSIHLFSLVSGETWNADETCLLNVKSKLITTDALMKTFPGTQDTITKIIIPCPHRTRER